MTVAKIDTYSPSPSQSSSPSVRQTLMTTDLNLSPNFISWVPRDQYPPPTYMQTLQTLGFLYLEEYPSKDLTCAQGFALNRRI